MARKWTIVIARAIINDPAQTGEKISWFRGMTENRTSVLKGTLMVLYQTPSDHLTARELSWRFIINLLWSFLVCKQLYWQLRRERFRDDANRASAKFHGKSCVGTSLQMPGAGEIHISHSDRTFNVSSVLWITLNGRMSKKEGANNWLKKFAMNNIV